MNVNTAKTSIKKVATTATALEPSSLIVLYEIDLSNLLKNSERRVYSNTPDYGQVLRFHNNVKLIETSIFYNNKEYHPAPINTDGFETSSKGSPPMPRLSVTINYEGLPEGTSDRIKYLKLAIRDLDNLSGAKVTRIRTFAKYLDGQNFYNNYGTNTQKLISNVLVPPEDFDPDPNAQFPQDVYYVDRKSAENKNTVEFELASPFDLQDIKLPGRVVTEFNCVWAYRGEGCCYEYNAIKKSAIGEIHHNENGNCKSITNAPPLATFKNELFTGGKFLNGPLKTADRDCYKAGALWSKSCSYDKGEFVRIEMKGVNYYFVSIADDNLDNPPPNEEFWYADECSKTLSGCRLRWSEPLPIGAFPTSRRGGTK